MNSRQARVSNAGCGIFLTANDLRALGVDPKSVDAVDYTITESGSVVIELSGGEE